MGAAPDTNNRKFPVRKLTFAVAVLASLGAAALTAPASAAPGAPIGVTAPNTIEHVQMRRMERRMMRNRMERRMMHRRMERRMMHRRMERRMMRRM